jgi:hypothetical protein
MTENKKRKTMKFKEYNITYIPGEMWSAYMRGEKFDMKMIDMKLPRFTFKLHKDGHIISVVTKSGIETISELSAKQIKPWITKAEIKKLQKGVKGNDICMIQGDTFTSLSSDEVKSGD